MNSGGGYARSPKLGFEEVDDARDREPKVVFQVSNAPIVGDGRGVMSSMAAIWGEEIVDPGDSDPAVECR